MLKLGMMRQGTFQKDRVPDATILKDCKALAVRGDDNTNNNNKGMK
jgi:hypothetical protein